MIIVATIIRVNRFLFHYPVAADYNQAIKMQKLLEELSELPSSDATVALDRYGKRPL